MAKWCQALSPSCLIPFVPRLAYPVCTNIVDLLLDPAIGGTGLVGRCAQRGLGIEGPWDAPAAQWIRLATYHGISDKDIDAAADILAKGLRES